MHLSALTPSEYADLERFTDGVITPDMIAAKIAQRGAVGTLDRGAYETRMRVGSMNRDRLTRTIAEQMAQRDALPEGLRRDNLTRAIAANDDELESWRELVADAEARIAEIDRAGQVDADRAVALAAE